MTEMEQWDRDVMDLEVPAYIEFTADGAGEFQFILVRGEMDCRYGERDGKRLVEFTWEGCDELDEVHGRGWAVVETADRLSGEIIFHGGDSSLFQAKREGRGPAAGQRGRR